MAELEEIERDAHRAPLTSDVRGLVDKCCATFGWDVPEIDETLSHRLIVKAWRQALDELVQQALSAA